MTTRGSLASDAIVTRIGTDTSGRGIFMSGWMKRCWDAAIADPRLDRIRSRIIVVQGPWMIRNGGGADASEGYHDRGGCVDCRSREFSPAEIALFVLVMSEYGFQFWRRDAAHGGMDPHLHGVFGSDYDLAPGAAEQVRELRETPRGDGLAGSAGRDYEHRVTPIRVSPPAELLEEDYMATNEAAQKLDQILRQTKATRALVKGVSEQVDAIADAVVGLPGATEDIKTRITKSKRDLAALIKTLDQED
jgi:hypothetical protein